MGAVETVYPHDLGVSSYFSGFLIIPIQGREVLSQHQKIPFVSHFLSFGPIFAVETAERGEIFRPPDICRDRDAVAAAPGTVGICALGSMLRYRWRT